MIIVNPGAEDYHMHSLNFSDGLSTVEEMVKFAGEIGLTRIAIIDHSQITLDQDGIGRKGYRETVDYWENVHNNVEVIFGIEGDLLDEKGHICDQIHGVSTDFLILSAHPKEIYR